ncbi:MAG: alanine racemase [Treponema sp.]|jgi:D-serine deaminase-like pyridoxal phosphate-dependent protein|nr:alanine racemase [Treponema sp.]
MNLSRKILAELETPCIIIDVEQVRRNIAAMQRAADEAHCRLRPHIKTHKTAFFARMQAEAGAAGITCAKVSEAEVMAAGGLDDIFIAYPLVGAFRIRRALVLVSKLKRLILAVDSLAGAQALSEAAREAGLWLEVRLEIDTGKRRTGVPLEAAAGLAEAVAKLPGLELTGIYTFKGLLYRGAGVSDHELAAREEAELLEQIAQEIRRRGVNIRDISGGSTPTALALARIGKVNEIRPGTYIFNDIMTVQEGAARVEDMAVRYAATVVSCPRPDYAVIDGGTKCFPTDTPLNTLPGNYPGYALVEDPVSFETADHLRLDRMNEEHGIIRSTSGLTGLSVGQVITLVPIHVCTAINMQNSVYLLEKGAVRRQVVEARGMLV